MQGWEPKDAATVVIAAVALIVPTLSAWHSRSNKRAEDTRSVRSQMNELVTKIIDVQMQNQKEYREALKKNELEEWQLQSSITNQKLISFARIAVFLDNQGVLESSDTEYYTIAQALAAGGDPLADAYWTKAIQSAPNPLYQIFNRRGYADYLFSQGRPKEAQDMYQSCLRILKDDSDFTRYTDGYTYRMWGVSERAWGSALEAEAKFANAQEKYQQIQRAQMKEFALRDLAYARAQSTEQAQQGEQRA
jgi:tetratricopeptide (TPR) repeat protein